MMYYVNKSSLSITEQPHVQPFSEHFVMVGKLQVVKDNTFSFYAETLEEAQAMAAKMRAERVAFYNECIRNNEKEIAYYRRSLAEIS
jgi:hypothetical protein